MRRLAAGRLLVATHNAGKLAEMAALLHPYGVVAVGAADLGLPEPAETEDSFIGNARLKAHAAAGATGLPALSDDSGLCIAALGGAPGVHTADWAQTATGRDFVAAMRRAHDALEAAKAPHPRLARFCCTLVVAWPDGEDAVFEGALEGRITWPPRGTGGHGYDPIFVPEPAAGIDGHDEEPNATFAQIDPALKNRISHRARAFAAFAAACLG